MMRMHRWSLSMILLFGILLLLPVVALSEEEPSESLAAIVPGPEDKEIIAVMEILTFMDLAQSMDMVKDLDVLIEEYQNANQD